MGPTLDMLLFCPACGLQHIDRPETDAEYAARLHETAWWELGGLQPQRWMNPPHKSHLCVNCQTVWRQADVPTNGVLSIQTSGKDDTWRMTRCASPAIL